jgi:acetyl-CoA carboxylase beta subunit
MCHTFQMHVTCATADDRHKCGDGHADYAASLERCLDSIPAVEDTTSQTAQQAIKSMLDSNQCMQLSHATSPINTTHTNACSYRMQLYQLQLTDSWV